MNAGPSETVDRVLAWFDEHARPLPWRDPACTPWGVLVSEFMLQQTQVARVLPRWQAFLERWPDPASLAAAGEAEVLRAWDRLGYPRRALWLRRCAVAIRDEHGGRVPSEEAELRALPGVGPYTAAAVACFAFGRPTAVVDTNVRRVLARLFHGDAEAWPPNERRDRRAAREAVPEAAPEEPAAVARTARWNAAAMELGALVCTAASPDCARCPVADACAWQAAGRPRPQERPARRRQPRFAGSDREMRGRVLAVLRARDAPVPVAEARAAAVRDEAADAERFDRALDTLAADALLNVTARGELALPGEG